MNFHNDAAPENSHRETQIIAFVTYHGLGARLRGGSSEDRTGSDLGKLVEDGFKVVLGPHVIAGRRHGSSARGRHGAREGAGGKDSEGHGCYLVNESGLDWSSSTTAMDAEESCRR